MRKIIKFQTISSKLGQTVKDLSGEGHFHCRESGFTACVRRMAFSVWGTLLCLSLLTLLTIAQCRAAETAEVSAATNEISPAQTVETAENDSGSRTPEERPVSLKKLAPNILHDQAPIWTAPVLFAQGKHWKPVLAVTALTAGLIVADPYDEPYFRNSSGFQTYKTGPLRGRNTTIAITIMPLAMYLGGHFTDATHAERTGLLAGEAIADTQILSWAMKAMNGRLHPSEIPPHGNFRDTWFKYQGTWNNPGSFPSGHSISAFAVASVFSTRYRDHRWVPWVSYLVATAVSLSRVPDQAHFPSDIFAGAALGYAVTHYVVLKRP